MRSARAWRARRRGWRSPEGNEGAVSSEPAPGEISEHVQGPEPDPEERFFLAGPRSRGSDLKSLLTLLAEFIRSFLALHFLGPCVTLFGSGRFKEDHPYYAIARSVGQRRSKPGLTVKNRRVGRLISSANS